jgi:Transposase DNA-binding
LQINEQTISRDNTILKAVLTGLQLPITLTTRADPLIGEILSRNRQKAVCDPWKVNVGFIERLVDVSLGTRGSATEFHKLLTQIGSAMGQSIPLVCQDWANTKAAYRFFSSP